MSPDISQMGASSISRIIANTCCQNRTQSLTQIRHEVMSDRMFCMMNIFAFRKFAWLIRRAIISKKDQKWENRTWRGITLTTSSTTSLVNNACSGWHLIGWSKSRYLQIIPRFLSKKTFSRCAVHANPPGCKRGERYLCWEEIWKLCLNNVLDLIRAFLCT